jgi:uncharacterized protein
MEPRKLALVTGASSGIGYQLARRAVEDGYDLVIAADGDRLATATEALERLGARVEPVQVDLATRQGIDELWRVVEGRDVDLFFANAGSALGEAFHDQDWTDIRRLIDLNVTQTTAMLHRMARKMRDRGEGRILITGSIGGFVPGPFDAVYNASKAYLNSLSEALRDELRETGVTITCLMPGPTESRIFEVPGLRDAPIHDAEKDDTAMVARAGYEAMMRGDAGVVPGFTNKVLTMLSGVVPSAVLAQIHRLGAEPRS